jgi:hypothetical protein
LPAVRHIGPSEIGAAGTEARLGIGDAARTVSSSGSELAVVVILAKESPEQPVRANLNGPLIINLDARRGLQHVFDRLDYRVNPTEKP